MAITKEEVIAKCSPELIASRDCHAIAAAVSEGRKKPNRREIGYGSILETVGFEAGNAISDELTNNQVYRYVKPLLEQGRMLIGSAMVWAALDGMVSKQIITASEADKLKALGLEDDLISPLEVAQVLYNADGSMK